jgi:aminoglycoside phosphotransferase (APT) family kinase protein
LRPSANLIPAFEPPEPGSSAGIVQQVNWWRRVWEEDHVEDVPIVNVAAQWLTANAPPIDHVSLVHGDYRSGNFLFNESDGQITSILDWELAVLGDRHQDLTWATALHFGHLTEDGITFLASGLLPVEELFRLYEEASGLTVDPKRISYFRIFNAFMSTVHMLATARRVAMQSKTHQDVVVAWLAMIGPMIVAQLRDDLEEVLQ